MSRRGAALAVAAIAVAALAAVVWWRLSGVSGAPPSEVPGEETAAAISGERSGTVVLFFPGRGSRLQPEERPVPETTEPEALIQALVEALLAGPQSEGLYPLFPFEVTVGSVYLSPEGIAFVDLSSAEAAPPASGSRREMLTVYGLVNTVMTNLQGVEGVVLLWNGRQRPTFAGHLDTARPLTLRRDL